MNTLTSNLVRALPVVLAACLSWPAQATGYNFETIELRRLPETLHGIWNNTKPDMNENSRCAAAFDSHSDPSRMVMRCSVYMRMGAEAERRAIAHCEEERARRGVHMPCKIVKE
jgi:hypothetical protein